MDVILRIPCTSELHGQVIAAAERDDRSMASWIRVAINEKLDREWSAGVERIRDAQA